MSVVAAPISHRLQALFDKLVGVSAKYYEISQKRRTEFISKILSMADDDWKKRVGIEINFTSDSDDEGVNNLQEERKKNDGDQFPIHIKSNEFSIEGNRFLDDHILNEYAEYGTTPPRTRISRRQKERKQRDRSDTSDIKVSSSIKTKRRNTLDSIYFNEILERCEDGNISSQEYEQLNRVDTTRRSKRSMKIIRGSERDMKLDHASARHSMPPTMEHVDDRAESMPIQTPQAIKIETCNRFLSLTSKLVACSKLMHKEDKPKIDYPQNRVEFYNTFSLLIRMGSSENKGDKNPRRQLSKEEHLWQNELKDIIWLELQAWHADRTSTEQDEYLCAARESVGTLLDNIMNYRFTRSPIQESYPLHSGRVSTQSSDSGISVDGKLSAPSTPKITTCIGCLSIYCQICKENQNAALKDVEELLNRLEAAESLYPSSKAFGAHYPLYKSSIFVGRVKAMCLWYNMTKHHRLMMMILGKLLMLLQSKNSHWPQVGDEDTSGIVTDASVSEDQGISSRRTSVEGKPFTKLQSRVVQFEMDSSSPSDSNNSNASSHGTGELSETISEVDYYNPANISKLQTVLCHSTKPSPISPYRKYIEDMLKTKGLRKSLNFLEKLHRYVLIKATATLRKPKEQDTLTEGSSSIPPDKNIEFVSSVKDLPNRTSFYSNSMDLAEDEEEELVRYGYWSVEAQDLHLPSYRSAFLFLSRIPLEVIHEFLRMRLEQKPEEPSVLCIRQLMRELKEGLRIAVLHKQRYLCLLHTTLWDVEKQTLESFEEGITEFDNSMKTVLELYLEYLQKWVPQVHQERFQKNILEEEWLFVKKTCPNIPGGEGLAANSFCRIASGMLEEIGRYLTSGVKELTKNLYNGDLSQEDFSIKQVVLSVCREFQFLYNEARERALKALAFAKTLRKDLECGTFVLKNQPSCSVIIAGSLQELKTEALTLCHDITTTIRTLEDTYNLHELGDLDDCDKIQLLNRCREILHLGYKFGFEYHKEVCRLVTGDARAKLSHGLISFAQQWMKFVKERCERGRGLRPRWANQGLDFLMTVCEPENTLFLSNSEFEELKKSIDECISHVIGTAVPVHDKCVTGHSSLLNHTPRGSLDGQYPRSRGSSPVSRTKSPSYRSSRSMQDASNSPSFPPAQRSFSANMGSISIDEGDIVDGAVAEVLFVPPKGASRIQRVFAAVRKLDSKLEEKLRNKELIGSVTDVECEDKIHIKSRSVTFSWQRGIKIGQGRFGKVYTAVNNQTGELMAMKEIQLQPNDHRTIRRVAEELKTFEGIHHQALVRYYGVEIHREEMLIFMEFCTEGTLESLVAATESGLPEVLIRRYTHQLLEAVVTLHNYGIVHRDIKSANIFLTDKGNSLKLGDFGSAVKIKAHTTMPGELQGFVGTQAYMAPEVFMNSEGHGRAADVWSLGCVIVEMASGERPWAEFDSNYQIMFKVGMGETPSVSDSLSDEGHQFVDLCLQHDPKKRAAAQDLLHHTFVKVDIDDDHISSIPSIFEESLKIIKR